MCKTLKSSYLRKTFTLFIKGNESSVGSANEGTCARGDRLGKLLDVRREGEIVGRKIRIRFCSNFLKYVHFSNFKKTKKTKHKKFGLAQQIVNLNLVQKESYWAGGPPPRLETQAHAEPSRPDGDDAHVGSHPPLCSRLHPHNTKAYLYCSISLFLADVGLFPTAISI